MFSKERHSGLRFAMVLLDAEGGSIVRKELDEWVGVTSQRSLVGKGGKVCQSDWWEMVAWELGCRLTVVCGKRKFAEVEEILLAWSMACNKC